jgi:hypothetical protein
MDSPSAQIIPGVPTSRPPVVLNGLECFGHSYMDNPFVGTATNTSSITTLNDNNLFQYVFAQALGLGRERVKMHAVFGSQFLEQGRSQGGFARALSEITKSNKTQYPFNRQGGAYLFCWGANDVGNQSAANQSKLNTNWQNAMIAVVSKARASTIYLANGGAPWALGSNFSAAPTAALDYTSGNATNATVVDSGGTSTATFTIPIGYMGEPICFSMVGLSSGTLVVTWGGTVTGTTGIVGLTTTLGSTTVNTETIVGVRFTGPANGLSAANAGQTISVRITSVTSATFTLDGCWIESWKPNPVLWCNMPRLPERLVAYQFGDGVTTGATTSFTSNTASFLTATDAGQSITEIDTQGALGAGLTVASVTNSTTIVLSGNANGAFTSIKYRLNRLLAGYSNGQYGFTNTDFTGATAANHTAADNDVLTLNATIAATAALFDSMVQVVDCDTAMGSGDNVANLPANVYSWFALDGNHPNDLGIERLALYCWKAAAALRDPPTSLQPMSPLDLQMSPLITGFGGPLRRVRRSGQVYLPDCVSISTSTLYLAVAGDCFAYPFFVSEPTEFWGVPIIDIITNGTTGTTVRVGYYDDVNLLGYPQNLRIEATSSGAVALGTTTGVGVAIPSFAHPVHYGLNWLVFKIDAIGGTGASLATVAGPSPYLPNSNFPSALVNGFAPIAWKTTGLASGALPNNFPTGATLFGSSSVAASAAPAVGVTITID